MQATNLVARMILLRQSYVHCNMRCSTDMYKPTMSDALEFEEEKKKPNVFNQSPVL